MPSIVGQSREARVPLFGRKIGLPVPSRGSVAWYAGLGAMAAFEVIDWPVALVVAASHALATRTQDPAVRQLGAGAEAGS